MEAVGIQTMFLLPDMRSPAYSAQCCWNTHRVSLLSRRPCQAQAEQRILAAQVRCGRPSVSSRNRSTRAREPSKRFGVFWTGAAVGKKKTTWLSMQLVQTSSFCHRCKLSGRPPGFRCFLRQLERQIGGLRQPFCR